MKVLLELISFIFQFILCMVIITVALPFIIIKVMIELAIDSLSKTSLIKRIISHK